MPFDLHINIPEDSAAAKAVRSIAKSEHITAEQAAAKLLMEAADLHGRQTPADEMWGAFSSPEDVVMLEDIVAEAYTNRTADQPRV